ncbi:tetraacyldisaccharide 4'-kinase [Parahalioglobus pacificus]|uniref:tetraacyldisaccharide 4'-kinase n=1 Tax=Parahalioglobus pacificus TaxID=930806 RepID=UPI001679FB65|nr:tetraacyldisaccharide 4'-kinase [Halioglobus pacificus]
MSESRLVRAWYAGAAWLWLLLPLEWLFRAVTSVRRWLYRNQWLKSYRAPVPVVVVGNVTVGGTGKTPFVIALVNALLAQGVKPGVVSRGYGAQGLKAPREVTPGSDPIMVGDEPLLIARKTGVPVVVSPKRPDAVRCLLGNSSVDLIISDDGLQHYALGRDREIVLIDAVRALGNGHCLPAGPLRDPPSRLATVDHTLFRGGTNADTGFSYQLDLLTQLTTGEQRTPSPAALGDAVHAVAGIGQPEQFFAQLRATGFEVIAYSYPDHHKFQASDFASMDDRPIIMTEKDAVKCAAFADARMWSLSISTRVPDVVVDDILELSAESHTKV